MGARKGGRRGEEGRAGEEGQGQGQGVCRGVDRLRVHGGRLALRVWRRFRVGRASLLSVGDAYIRSLSLWDTGKKKPIFTLPLAHGIDELTTEQETKGARWITSLGHLRGTDLFASGKSVAIAVGHSSLQARGTARSSSGGSSRTCARSRLPASRPSASPASLIRFSSSLCGQAVSTRRHGANQASSMTLINPRLPLRPASKSSSLSRRYPRNLDWAAGCGTRLQRMARSLFTSRWEPDQHHLYP